MKEAIAILTGGGPAPGMNTVVGSVAKTFLAKGYRVIGLHYGYSGLFNPSPRYEDLNNAGRSSPDSPSYSHAVRRRWLLICSALLTDEILQHHVRCYRVPSAFMQMLLVLFYMRYAVFHIRFESHSVNSCGCIGVPYTIPVSLYHLPVFGY